MVAVARRYEFAKTVGDRQDAPAAAPEPGGWRACFTVPTRLQTVTSA
jgi:hypothetical protein